MRECRLAADNVFDYAAQMLFQGLTSAVYVRANSTDTSLNGTAVGMVRDGDADVEWRIQLTMLLRICHSEAPCPVGKRGVGVIQ
jgi:hypothetical protein